MYDRLVGVPPTVDPVTGEDPLADMLAFMPNDPLLAAERAMEEPGFVNVTLKNFVTPWTNVEQSVFEDLNDYSALVIGLIRDGTDFRQVLTGDLAYVANPNIPGIPVYSVADNEHYRAIEANRVDLSDLNQFQQTQQSLLYQGQNAISSGDTAGVITTRQAGKEFFSAGTNRRMWRFMSMNYLCRDLEQMKDVSREADWVRQDVNRSPGGDSELFHNHCVGCHSGMDPMAGAFAYFEWDTQDPDNENDGMVLFTPGNVSQKHLINANAFPGGYITTDDRWENFWRGGVNASLGWRGGVGGGNGPKSLGAEVAESRAFAVCQVEKVFRQVCFRQPNDDDEVLLIRDIADDFEDSGYRMKTVFARAAEHCMGD